VFFIVENVLDTKKKKGIRGIPRYLASLKPPLFKRIADFFFQMNSVKSFHTLLLAVVVHLCTGLDLDLSLSFVLRDDEIFVCGYLMFILKRFNL